jgi:hypothetical protein
MTIPNPKILNPGDVLIDSITIESAPGAILDVRSQFVSMNIYEDIFANGLSGFIVLVDSLNLIRYLQITGREKLTIRFATPGEDTDTDFLTKEFTIYKVSSEVKMQGDGKKLIRLEFVSPTVYQNAQLRISRAFSDMPYSDMVKAIMKDTLGVEVNACPTLGNRNIVVPNWNPMYAVSWLAKRSAAETIPEACDYVFYENLNGNYQFMPLSLLKQRKSIVKYHHTPTSRNPETGELFLKKEFYNILSFTIGGRGDKMREVVSGVYGNNAVAIDIVGKQTDTEVYVYTIHRDRIPTISKYPLVSKISDPYSGNVTAYQKLFPKHSFKYDTIEDNDELHTVSTRRQSQMNQFRTNTLTIVVNGDSRRRVGEIVSVDIPSTEDPKGKDDWYDPYLSGRYMITAILHELGDGNYTMKMELVKDGYDERIPDVQTFGAGGDF